MTDTPPISEPGLYPDIPAETYHGLPHWSSSRLYRALTMSPAHARAAVDDEASTAQDVGSAVHAALLEGLDVCEAIEADSWRTNAAKEARDNARAEGRIPLLTKDYERVQAIVSAAIGRLMEHEEGAYLLHAAGESELTCVWDDDGLPCRMRADKASWLGHERRCLFDVKTTSRLARTWAERVAPWQPAFQMAVYRRGWKALHGEIPWWRWIVVETFEPFDVLVVAPGEKLIEVADADVEQVMQTVRECERTGVWPGYPAMTAVVDAPAWRLAKHEEQRAYVAYMNAPDPLSDILGDAA